MAAVKQAKTVAGGFGNQIDVVRVIYDYAKDGGATGALDLFTASGKIVVLHAHMRVITQVLSSGSATIKWGVTGDDDRFANTTQGAKANLTAGAVIVPPAVEGTPNVLPFPYVMADGDKILQTIGTEVLTQGVIEYVVAFLRP